MLASMVCRYSDFALPWYRNQERNLRIRDIYVGHSAERQDFVNRKFWEWCAIVQALEERGNLCSGKAGLGFAVGTEPLASYFAGKDCKVLATDLDSAMSDPAWISTGQHAASLDALFQPLLAARELFDARVSFKPADMRSLEGLNEQYDFLWSSCALEHLGTLNAGLEFVVNSAALLKAGGVAVHTTEYNVNSDDATLESGPNVIYRRKDILELSRKLESRGFKLATPDFDTGAHQFDKEFDVEPYMTSDRRHLKLMLGGHVSTSMLLIVEAI
jgi:2-polyprenyl-3-methyl-5-hydroxy-6-metoxy-1,4-benzoquinol methylase